MVYRWFLPNYYKAGWARQILVRYAELEGVVEHWPMSRPDRVWLAKHRSAMSLFDSMRAEGMINPLIIKPAGFPTVSDTTDARIFHRHVEVPDLAVIIGNQRLFVLRMFYEFGWLKSPFVSCRMALPDDPPTDRCTPTLKHPYLVKKGGRWVNP